MGPVEVVEAGLAGAGLAVAGPAGAGPVEAGLAVAVRVEVQRGLNHKRNF